MVQATNSTAVRSGRHDHWVRTKEADDGRQEAQKSLALGGDSSMSRDGVKKALEDLLAKEPKDAAASKATLDKALQSAGSKILSDETIQILLNNYVIKKADGSDAEKEEALNIFKSTSDSNFGAFLTESFDKNSAYTEFLKGLYEFVLAKDDTQKAKIVAGEDFAKHLKIKTSKGVNYSPESPMIQTLEGLSNQPLVQALVKAAKASGLATAISKVKSGYGEVQREISFADHALSRETAKTKVIEKLGKFFVHKGGDNYELKLGEFGTLRKITISSDYKRNELGIDDAKNDPFAKAGISSFDPFNVVVDILAAAPKDRAKVAMTNFAYLHAAMTAELVEAERLDAGDGPLRKVGTQYITNEKFVRSKYEKIKEILIDGDNLVSQVIANALKDGAGYDKEVADMLTAGNVEKSKEEALNTAFADIAEVQSKRRWSLEDLVTKNADGSFSVAILNDDLNVVNKTVSFVDKDDAGYNGTDTTLKDALDSYKSGVDEIASAVSKQIHTDLDKQMPLTQEDIDTFRNDVDTKQKALVTVVDDKTKSEEDKFKASKKLVKELVGSLASAKNGSLLRFESSGDGVNNLKSELTNFFKKIAPSEGALVNSTIKEKINFLAQEMVRGNETQVQTHIEDILKLMAENTYSAKGNQEADRNRDSVKSKQASISFGIKKEADKFVKLLIADKPQVSDLTKNLNIESFKVAAEEDTPEGREIARVMKRLSGEDSVSDAIKHAKTSASTGINLLCNSHPITGKYNQTLGLIGFSLVAKELSEGAGISLVKRFMVNDSKFGDITDPRERDIKIEDEAKRILDQIKTTSSSTITVTSKKQADGTPWQTDLAGWASDLVSYMDSRNELEMAYNDANAAELDAYQQHVGKFADFMAVDADVANQKDLFDRTQSGLKALAEDKEVLNATNPIEKILEKTEGKSKTLLQSLITSAKGHLRVSPDNKLKGAEGVKSFIAKLARVLLGIKNSFRHVEAEVKSTAS